MTFCSTQESAPAQPQVQPDLRLRLKDQARQLRARAPEGAALDTVAPTVSAFKLRGSVDASRSGPFVIADLGLSDDLSGVHQLILTLVSPSGRQIVQRWMNVAYPARNVSFSATIGADHGSFGRYSEPGIWQVQDLVVMDANGNLATFDRTALAALGNTQVSVSNTRADTTGPQLVSGQVLTPSLSVSRRHRGTRQPPFVGVTLNLTDSGESGSAAGVRQVDMTLCKYTGTADCGESIMVYGDVPLFGRSQVKLTLGGSIYAATPGTYHIHSMSLMDAAGNSVWMQSTLFGGETDFSAYFPATTVELTP